MKNRVLFYTILIISAITISCNGKSNIDKKIRSVKTTTVTTISNGSKEVISGIINAGEERNPSFRTSGMVSKVHIKIGDNVKQGDIIAELDQRDYIEASAIVASKYAQVNSEVGRVIELFERNSVARNEYEKAISGKETFESINNLAKNLLKDTKLTSPISGVVQSVDIEPGIMVLPGFSVASIINTKSISISCNFSPTLYQNRTKISSIKGYFNNSNVEIPLSIKHISPKANNSQSFRVELIADKKYANLLTPGLVIRIELTFKGDDESKYALPLEAIAYNNTNEPYVWVLNKQNNRVNKRSIQPLLLLENGMIEIKGVEKDEVIVTAGLSFLDDNMEVQELQQPSQTNVGGLK